MRFLITPAIDDARLEKIRACAPTLEVTNTNSEQIALDTIRTAEGFYGKITPQLLAAATQLRWVQSPTASLGALLVR